MSTLKKGSTAAIGIFVAILAASLAGLVLSAVMPNQTQVLLRVLLSLGIAVGLGGAAFHIYARTKAARRFKERVAADEISAALRGE